MSWHGILLPLRERIIETNLTTALRRRQYVAAFDALQLQSYSTYVTGTRCDRQPTDGIGIAATLSEEFLLPEARTPNRDVAISPQKQLIPKLVDASWV
jgi:hypothetical protein